jgi:S-methylmethionine-dependent homocysteine/selenocysteine methylase
VSWTLQDAATAPRLRGGERLPEAVRALATGLERGDEAGNSSAEPPQALLVNCCAPQAVTAAMPALVEAVAAAPGWQEVRLGGYVQKYH